MYETGRRAQQAHALNVQRVEWLGRLPDSKEDFKDLAPSPAAGDELPWFQIKGCHAFQPPSMVLVEKVVFRDDVDIHQKQKADTHQKHTPGTHQKQTPDIHQKQTSDIHQKQTSDIHQKRTPDTHQKQKADIHQKQKADIHQKNTPDIHQKNTPDIHQKNTPDIHQNQKPDTHQKQKKHPSAAATAGNKSKLGDKPPNHAHCTNRHEDDQEKTKPNSVFVNKGRAKMKRGKLTKRHSEGGSSSSSIKAEWKHGNAVKYGAGAKTIDEGLLKDGLGHVPHVASTLTVIRRVELSIEGFFDFLFSNRWSEGCLLRVLKGHLLDSLLHVLTQMLISHTAVCHSTMAFICQQNPLEPCKKTAATNGKRELVEERVLVELDCFYPQSPEVEEQPIPSLDSSKGTPSSELSQGIPSSAPPQQIPLITVSQHIPSLAQSQQIPSLASSETFIFLQDQGIDSGTSLERPRVRCNVRGLKRPPPHRDCFRSYHVLREPFMLRRRRELSAFVFPSLPDLPAAAEAAAAADLPAAGVKPCLQHVPSVSRQPSLRGSLAQLQGLSSQSTMGQKKEPEEDRFVGPRFKDCTEPVATDVLLTPISKLLSEGYVPPKLQPKPHDSGPSTKPPKPVTDKKEKKTNKKNKKNKKYAKDSVSEEYENDALEQQAIKSHIDPSRVTMLENDIKNMNSELSAKQPTPKTLKDRRGVGKELEMICKAKHEKVKKHEDLSAKEPTTKQSTPIQALPLIGESFFTSKKMTHWSYCPSFAKFYDFLKGQEETERSISTSISSRSKLTTPEQKQSAMEKVKKTVLLPVDKTNVELTNSDQSVKQPKKSRSQKNADRYSSSSGERKNKSNEGQKTERERGTNNRESPSRQKKATTEPIPDDAEPYVYISDSEVPNDITAKNLLTLMQVDRYFKPEKLKSSYSFEKMFAHRADQIRNYPKLLSTFSKPFKKKKPKPKPVNRRKLLAQRAKAKSSQSPASKQTTDTEMSPERPAEPSPPPMVIGKLKDFKFLQHKNFAPAPHRTSAPCNEMTFTDIVQLLAQAMQKFVVRKERATTFGWSQCDSRVSVTFSKRGQDNFWLGIPPLKDDHTHIGGSSGDLTTT
ncbi:hypothetical protein ACOMHN_041844 [Nucella lapillus]